MRRKITAGQGRNVAGIGFFTEDADLIRVT